MKTTKQIIEELYGKTWCYSSYCDDYEKYTTQLSENPVEIGEAIKSMAMIISKSKSEKTKVVKDLVSHIIEYCRPDNWQDSHWGRKRNTTSIENAPIYEAKEIIKLCNELADSCKTTDDTTLEDLNKKWTGKWIYFNGDESGQQVILIDKIHYHGDELAFDGSMVELFNENSSIGGMGLHFYEVEDYEFYQLHYINYIDSDKYNPEDYDDDEYSDDFSNPVKLDAALSSSPIDTDMKSRVLTNEEFKELLDDYIYGEYGCIAGQMNRIILL